MPVLAPDTVKTNKSGVVKSDDAYAEEGFEEDEYANDNFEDAKVSPVKTK